MRTDQEILDRINQIKENDFMSFEGTDLIIRLPYNLAKQFLKKDAETTEKEWNNNIAPRDRESLLKGMEEYMPFAWRKANDCRGISAYRSLAHFNAWTWLAGDDFGDMADDYEHYGKEHLIRICEHYGWDHTQWDDGRRVNTDSE